MKIHLILTVAALALASCGSPGSDKAADGGNGSAAAKEGRDGGSRFRTGLEPGEWEITTELANMEDAPKLEAVISGKVNSEEDVAKALLAAVRSVERQCLTSEKAAELFAGDPGEGCKREGEGWRNGRISTKVTCAQIEAPQTSVHEVSGSYSARSFDVTQRLSEVSDGDTTTTATRTRGRRLGDCPAGKN